MPASPDTSYARAPDGVHIAYQTIGEGPHDLVLLSSHACVDLMWEDPVYAHVLERMARIGRLICFDWRGWGASDPISLGALPTIDAWSDDVRVVLDAAGSSRATLVGHGLGGGHIALYLAAAHPDRFDALVLVNATSRAVRDADYPFGLSAVDMDATCDVLTEHWGQGTKEMADLFCQSRCADEAFRSWHGRFERLAMSPLEWRAAVGWATHLDVRDALGSIRLPTLVLHARDLAVIPVTMARYLAAHIDDAQIEILPGSDFAFHGDNGDRFVDRIAEFLTGAPATRGAERVLATVLFTDIVGSTANAARLGDKQWTELLHKHDLLARHAVESHRGRWVKSTGDGLLAMFDGPTRAVRCAQAISTGVRSLGIQVRAGLHTGEIELLDDEVGGIAVHIGQRVSSFAAPDEILVSRTVTELVAGSGIEFDARGEFELKGVEGRWPLFAVA